MTIFVITVTKSVALQQEVHSLYRVDCNKMLLLHTSHNLRFYSLAFDANR